MVFKPSDGTRGCRDRFQFPLKSKVTEDEFLRCVKDRKVVVIGVFGKSARTVNGGKADFVDAVTQKDVFRIVSNGLGDDEAAPSSMFIEGFHDVESDRIYLHVRNWNDAHCLVQESRKAKKDIEENGFLRFCTGQRYEGIRLMLFLFHVCHLVVCYHPSHTFDTSYIFLFQALDSIRSKIQPNVTDCLRQHSSLSKDWISYGRPCVPRLIFYFATSPIALRGVKGMADLVKRDGKISKHPPVRKLEFSLEDQIYRILKKTRVITASSNNLFLIPPRDGFVFVDNGGSESFFGDQMAERLANLYTDLSSPPTPEDSSGGPFAPYFYAQTLEASRSQRCFARFLTVHMEAAAARTVTAEREDKVVYETPAATKWYLAAQSLYTLFFETTDLDRRCKAILANHTDVDGNFSEARCAKALPQAVAAYKEGLPQHYLQDYHNAKLLQVMSLFSVQARGPAVPKYAELLAEECTAYWQQGRQMCEELSLTGNNCINRKHQIPEEKAQEKEGEKKGKKILPSMAHSSGVVYLSSCNCGRHQADREDPFSLMEANCSFYAEAEEDCCQELQHQAFPVYEATTGFRTPVLSSSSLKDYKSGGDTEASAAENTKTEEEGESKETLQTLASLATTKTMKRQSSGLECIQNMLTKSSLQGKLPAFSSWSLVCLGNSSLYTHSAGVNQPGFLQSAKFLLPWDVPLRKLDWPEIRDHWPNLADNAMKKSSFNPGAKGSEMGLTVKIFLGIEYECPRGHRFMAASPDRAMKATPSALRDAAGKVVGADMPLYMACPCSSRQSRPDVAQLMRVHVVTPKAPLHVTLLPQVIPCPNGPTFVSGWTEPVNLSISSYWVLRLPYIYCSEEGSHLPPSDVPESNYGLLLKGFLGYTEEYEQDQQQ